MNAQQQKKGDDAYEVGLGRYNLYYSEPGRQLRFNMIHLEGPGRGILHILINPMPCWHSPDFSEFWPMSDSEKVQVFKNIEASLTKRMYQWVYISKSPISGYLS